MTTSAPPTTATAESLIERVFASALGAFDLAAIYLGDRLGYYHSLATDGPATSAELALRTDTDERYAREWLEQQAVSGLLTVDDSQADASARRFVLPEAYRSVLVDPESLNLMAPLARMQAAAFGRLPELEAAYRSGSGVSWRDFGADMRGGQADFNRPAFANLLGTEWIPAIPSIHERLGAQPPARVADVACGEGWSTLALASSYPHADVTGIDIDEPSVEAARRHAFEAGLADRVRFTSSDAALLEGRFDLVTIFEAVHDMADPVSVLAAVRRSLAPEGVLLVADERVGEEFVAPGTDVERFMYGWSILVCLPDGRSTQPSAATGTVMRPDKLRAYARDAGFRQVEIAPIEHDFFRFYLLRP